MSGAELKKLIALVRRQGLWRAECFPPAALKDEDLTKDLKELAKAIEIKGTDRMNWAVPSGIVECDWEMVIVTYSNDLYCSE